MFFEGRLYDWQEKGLPGPIYNLQEKCIETFLNNHRNILKLSTMIFNVELELTKLRRAFYYAYNLKISVPYYSSMYFQRIIVEELQKVYRETLIAPNLKTKIRNWLEYNFDWRVQLYNVLRKFFGRMLPEDNFIEERKFLNQFQNIENRFPLQIEIPKIVYYVLPLRDSDSCWVSQYGRMSCFLRVGTDTIMTIPNKSYRIFAKNATNYRKRSLSTND